MEEPTPDGTPAGEVATGDPRRRPAWQVDLAIFLAAVVLAALAVGSSLAREDFDPTSLLRVGTYSTSRAFVEQDFDDPVLTPDAGHDGQQFYVMASTFPHLDRAEGFVDKLRYRARRILVPALTAAVPRGAPLVWSLLAVNMLAIGAAAVAFGHIARRVGVTAWIGLTVAATPAMLESARGSLSDAPAFALALWGVVVWRRRPWVAAALFLLAALARETTLVVPLACALVAPAGRRAPMIAPVVGWVIWASAVVAWLPAEPTARSTNPISDALVQLDLPFRGWIEVGLTDATLLGGVLLAAGLAAAWLLRPQLPEISLWLVADAALLVLSAHAVVFRPDNFARVAPLAVPAFVLAAVLRVSEYRRASNATRSGSGAQHA